MGAPMVLDGTEYTFSTIIEQCYPFFVVSLVLEIVLNVIFRKGFYRINDMISSLSAGTIMQVSERLALGFISNCAHVYIWHYYSLYRLDEHAWTTWILCFFLVDFSYWLFHWAGHVTNIGWAVHITHHNSEEYNLSTALRQSCTQIFVSFWFYLPYAFFIPPYVMDANKQFNTVYQFWVHTKWVGKMGILEYIINTPSAHRVHHARNPKYLDKNFAGTLIIWDRIFGTYADEEEECVYGITSPLQTWDVFGVQFHALRDIFSMMCVSEGFMNKLYCITKPPGWTPPNMKPYPPPPEVDPVEARKTRFNARINGVWDIYILVQFLVAMGFSLVMLTSVNIPYWESVLQGAFVIGNMYVFAYLFERRSLAVLVEVSRLLCLMLTSERLFKVGDLCIRTDLCATQVLWAFCTLSLVFVLIRQGDITRTQKTASTKSSASVLKQKKSN